MLLFLCGASAASANQPPGPMMLVSLTSLLPLMIVLTILGGGYTIFERLGKRHTGWTNFLWTIVLLFFALTQVGIGFLVSWIFGAIALWRACRMLIWGFRARQAEGPEHLVEASARRLLTAGSVLALCTVFLMGMSLAFLSYWPRSEEIVEQTITDFVAYEIAFSRLEQERNGRARFYELTPTHLKQRFQQIGGARKIRLEYSQEMEAFDVYLPPSATSHFGGFPFFPYNYLVSHPTYRADETGEIRMSYTHHADGLCPADAPVVRRVEELEIEEAHL
jgi:hypothetical protein